jgi:hypothetical protein
VARGIINKHDFPYTGSLQVIRAQIVYKIQNKYYPINRHDSQLKTTNTKGTFAENFTYLSHGFQY